MMNTYTPKPFETSFCALPILGSDTDADSDATPCGLPPSMAPDLQAPESRVLSLSEHIATIPYARQQKPYYTNRTDQPAYSRYEALPSQNIAYRFASQLVLRIASTKHMPELSGGLASGNFFADVVSDQNDALALTQPELDVLCLFMKGAEANVTPGLTPLQKVSDLLQQPYYQAMPKEVKIFLEAAFASCFNFDANFNASYFIGASEGHAWQNYASFIDQVRAICKRNQFRKELFDRNFKLPAKRFDSVKRLVDRLFSRYSRVLVVRVDLKYKPENTDGVMFEVHNRHIKRLLLQASVKTGVFKNCIGTLLRMEETPQAGLHSHAAFFFDGNHSQNDVGLGAAICNLWESDITKGLGLGWNVNSHWRSEIDKGNKQQSDFAVGMVHANDPERVEKMVAALGYLCHAGQDVINKDQPRAHTFWVRD